MSFPMAVILLLISSLQGTVERLLRNVHSKKINVFQFQFLRTCLVPKILSNTKNSLGKTRPYSNLFVALCGGYSTRYGILMPWKSELLYAKVTFS
ncbi:hypothetical protein BC940DRAFT_300669 [Gongronella butleri]|nr:hypothetical protein BC940DRAFT_300669 [Gongronella butleri]